MSSGRSATQIEILNATRDLIESEGAASVRLEDVGRRAGVSRQAVYLNFGSRAGLLVALVQYTDERERVSEQIERLFASETGAIERLDAYLDWWLGYLPKVHGIARALLAERDYDDAADAAWRDRMDALHRGVRNLIDQLAKEDALDPSWKAADAADWLWGLMSVRLYETMQERGWSGGRYASGLRRVVHAALLADRARS